MGFDAENEELALDCRRMERLAIVSKLKCEGDALFGKGNAQEAETKYTEAIEMDETFVSAVSNRAGSRLALGKYKECIQDCDVALELLSRSDEGVSGPVPPPGSDKRRDWVIKTMCRRGKAKTEVEDYVGALKDLKLGLKLVPEGRVRVRDDLAEDIENIEDFLKNENRD